MKINATWDSFTGPNGETYKRIVVSKKASNWQFRRIARHVNKKLGGEWVRKIDDTDQRYWDLAAGSALITLHYEHDFGISIYPTECENASLQSLGLMEEAYRACSS